MALEMSRPSNRSFALSRPTIKEGSFRARPNAAITSPLSGSPGEVRVYNVGIEHVTNVGHMMFQTLDFQVCSQHPQPVPFLVCILVHRGKYQTSGFCVRVWAK